MGKREKNQIILTRTSAVLVTLIILAVGFTVGVAMTIIKTSPSGGMESAPGNNLGKMAVQLESMVEANPKKSTDPVWLFWKMVKRLLKRISL